MFLLISSSAVYGSTNDTVNEFSPVERRKEVNPRAAKYNLIKFIIFIIFIILSLDQLKQKILF